MLIASPDKFAAEFNHMVPGAYRSIDAQDVRDMTHCGLIGRYGHYGRPDIETIRGILQHEELRQKRADKDTTVQNQEPLRCKRCGKPLSYQQYGKKGRPREYCPACEAFRARERYQRYSTTRKLKQKHQTEIKVM